MLKRLIATEANRRITITLRDRIAKEKELIMNERTRFDESAFIRCGVFILRQIIVEAVY